MRSALSFMCYPEDRYSPLLRHKGPSGGPSLYMFDGPRLESFGREATYIRTNISRSQQNRKRAFWEKSRARNIPSSSSESQHRTQATDLSQHNPPFHQHPPRTSAVVSPRPLGGVDPRFWHGPVREMQELGFFEDLLRIPLLEDVSQVCLVLALGTELAREQIVATMRDDHAVFAVEIVHDFQVEIAACGFVDGDFDAIDFSAEGWMRTSCELG